MYQILIQNSRDSLKNLCTFFHLCIDLLKFNVFQFAAKLTEFLFQAFVFGLKHIFEKRILPFDGFWRCRDSFRGLRLRLFAQIFEGAQFLFDDFLALNAPQFPPGFLILLVAQKAHL